MLYYSKTTNGFYCAELHGAPKIMVTPPAVEGQPDPVPVLQDNPDSKIPADAVEITPDLHEQMIQGQMEGQRIVPDANGFPSLVEIPPLTNDQLWASALQIMAPLQANAALMTAAGSPISDAGKAAWTAYAAALTALTTTYKTNPAALFAQPSVWPVAPA